MRILREAIRYIDSLHNQLVSQSGSSSETGADTIALVQRALQPGIEARLEEKRRADQLTEKTLWQAAVSSQTPLQSNSSQPGTNQQSIDNDWKEASTRLLVSSDNFVGTNLFKFQIQSVTLFFDLEWQKDKGCTCTVHNVTCPTRTRGVWKVLSGFELEHEASLETSCSTFQAGLRSWSKACSQAMGSISCCSVLSCLS